MGYYEGEIGSLYGNGGNNGFNGGWEGLIGLIIVAGMLNRNGGGLFGGGNGGGDNELAGWQLGRLATTNDVASGFNNSAVLSNQNDLKLALQDGFSGVQSTLCQGFSGVNATVTNAFANLNTNLASMSYNTQSGFNAISREIADCCCTQSRNIDSLRYDMSKGFCDIIRAGQDNTRAILDYLTGEKISALQAENSGLKAQISNDRQSAFIIDALAPKCPSPAYVVQPPQTVTFPTNCCGNTAYANYGAGYGSCGASVQ